MREGSAEVGQLGASRLDEGTPLRQEEEEFPGESEVSDGTVLPAEVMSRSACRVWQTVIEEKLDQGLTAQRIHQDLVADHGFEGKYSSVRRFVARLTSRLPLPFRRLEVPPGQEAQVDFGTGATLMLQIETCFQPKWC